LRLFNVQGDKRRGLKFVMEREKNGKQLWPVQTLAVNSPVNIYVEVITVCAVVEIQAETSGN
jgi:hypothetical protein